MARRLEPRYPKEAAAWNPKDDYSVFSEEIAFDDGTVPWIATAKYARIQFIWTHRRRFPT